MFTVPITFILNCRYQWNPFIECFRNVYEIYVSCPVANNLIAVLDRTSSQPILNKLTLWLCDKNFHNYYPQYNAITIQIDCTCRDYIFCSFTKFLRRFLKLIHLDTTKFCFTQWQWSLTILCKKKMKPLPQE